MLFPNPIIPPHSMFVSMKVLPLPTTLSHLSTLAFPYTGKHTFTRPKASPPIAAKQCYPLPHMQLEPWISPCVLSGW